MNYPFENNKHRDYEKKSIKEYNSGSYKSPNSAQVYKISPQITDFSIDKWLEPHYVAIDRSKSLRGKLFVFFSGSNGTPTRYHPLMNRASEAGYHAINLCYPNSWTVGGLCQDSRDPDCHEDVRLDIIDGGKRSNIVQIDYHNCIVNRLVKLLQYLNQRHPDEGWIDYIEGDTPKWKLMILGGHSQGGGQAAMIAKMYMVERVIMFAAPVDYSQVLKIPAPWISRESETPSNRYYGFVHFQDRGFKRIRRAWKLLGMAKHGPIVNMDEQRPPYNDSHRLITNSIPDDHRNYHLSVITDENSILGEVWNYLLDS